MTALGGINLRTPSRVRVARWLCVVALTTFFGQAQEGTATLRLAHLSPDAPRVDLLVDGELKLTDLSFSRFSGYLRLPPGEHEVQVFPHRLPRGSGPTREVAAQDATGGGAAEATPPAQVEDDPAPRRIEPITTFVTLDEGISYTLALVGFYEPPPPESELGGLAVNVVPEDSRVEVNGPDGTSATLTGSETLRGLRPGVYTLTVSREGYQPSRYDVAVQPGLVATATVTLQSEDTTAEEVPPQVAAPNQGSVWHKVELQLYQNSFESTAEQATVRVVHAAPTSPTVDISLLALDQGSEQADTVALTGLTFPNKSDMVAVPAGTYDLQLYAATTTDALTTLSGLWLEPGLSYTFYLVGTPGDEHVQVIPNVDALPR